MSDRKHFASKWSTKFYLLIIVVLASVPAIIYFANLKSSKDYIVEVEKPEPIQSTLLVRPLTEGKNLIRLNKAREKFSVSGKGLTVAVIDTGLRVTHNDFTGRVIAQRNFTSDNGGNMDDASDGNGHGTNVTGIIAADGIRNQGIAPDVKIIPIKALNNNSSSFLKQIEKALEWIIDNHIKYKITAVCMSFGDGENYTKDREFEILNKNIIQSQIKTLKDNKVAVIAAAGNSFYPLNKSDIQQPESKQGMAFPAIIRETISVGAVYDSDIGKQIHDSGATANKTAPEIITPFSQRLHETVNPDTKTDIFAPGASIISSGINSDDSRSNLSGTSQAAPVVTGVVLLLQEYYLRETGNLPSIDNLEKYLRDNRFDINDGDDEDDNVVNTGLDFIRIDALSALKSMDTDLNNQVE
ncbi:MAG: S8 family serine peptidase [Cyanobacteria bacterium P01_D01_bin.50]